MTKIYAPATDYNGAVGPVQFAHGVAETDDQAVIAYCRRAGYGIDQPAATTDVSKTRTVEPPPSQITIGTELRDAAVDPKPTDFLAPVNAGEADPHGPLVVSPEIHGTGFTGIVPGDVAVSEPDVQDAAEKAHAEAVLIESVPVPVATAADPSAEAPEGQPAKAANKATWVDYAVSRGLNRDEAEDMTIADLKSATGAV